MNIRKIKLYKGFLKLDRNFKNEEIANFIKHNCPAAPSILLSIVLDKAGTENERNSINDIYKQDKIIKKVNLNTLKKNCRFYGYDCRLCERKEFDRKRKFLDNLIKEASSIYTPIFNKKRDLNILAKEIGSIDFAIVVDESGKFILKKRPVTLFQRIIINFFEDFLGELNKIKKVESVSKYFLQIAIIFLEKKSFKDNIERIREKYYVKQEDISKVSPYFFKGSYIELKEFDSEIKKLMEEYNFYPRWRNWIICTIINGFKNNLDCCLQYIPTGSVGKLRKVLVKSGEAEDIGIDPIYVGDETKKQIDGFEEKYEQKIDIDTLKSRRKPITEFDKYLRWFKLKEKGCSYSKLYKKDSKDNPSDWADLLNHPNKKYYAESLSTDRIKQGLKEIRDRINKPK